MSENGGLLNDEEIDFLLASATAQDKEEHAASTANVEVTMRGDLRQISLTDIFQTLGLSKMEGILRLRTPIEQRLVHFRDSNVRILVPNRVATRRIGQRLIQANVITPDQLRSALLTQRKDGSPLGELLARQGLVTQEQIDDVIGTQVTEEMFALFTWMHGTFEFYKGAVIHEPLRRRLEQCPEFEVNSLLLEIARRQDEWQSILEAVCSLDEVPMRSPAAQDATDLSPLHLELLQAVDGRQTYRQLAESSLSSMFDAARAARDLVHSNLVVNIPDAQMLALARDLAQKDHPKRALMMVQTLRSRPNERGVGEVLELAGVLRICNELKLASGILLEAAEKESGSSEALELARQARQLTPRDCAPLRFLHGLLQQHSGKPGELADVTLALVDALTDDQHYDEVLSVLDGARESAADDGQLFLRRVRVLQRMQRGAEAVPLLLERAERRLAEGDRKGAAELFEQAVKIDPERRDLIKQAKSLRRSRHAQKIRVAVGGAIGMLLLASGTIYYLDSVRAERVGTHRAAVQQMIAAGDLDGARTKAEELRTLCGEGDDVASVAQEVDNAVAERKARERGAARRQILDHLNRAAGLLDAGDVAGAFATYDALQGGESIAAEVSSVVNSRFQGISIRLREAAKLLPGVTPAAPTPLTEHKQVFDGLERLRKEVQPELLQLLKGLRGAKEGGRYPSAAAPEAIQELEQAIALAAPIIDLAAQRLREFEAAAARIASEKRLEPLFRAAIEQERNHQFDAALATYRELEREHSGIEMKRHFRDQIERNATIVRFLDAIRQATQQGDCVVAQAQYRALKLAFPDLPVERLARLPMRIESQPAGAVVVWNGVDIGTTPTLLARLPADAGVLQLRMPGFDRVDMPVRGDQVGNLNLVLTRTASFAVELDGVVERSPVFDNEGRALVSDRAGTLTAFDRLDGKVLWRFRSGDLSGLLTRPRLVRDLVLIGSLDGTLRALRRHDGEQVWSTGDLETEFAPAIVDDVAILATTGGEMVTVQIADGKVLGRAPLGGVAIGNLNALAGRVLVPLEQGELHCRDPRGAQPVWRHVAGRNETIHVVTAGEIVVLATENGAVTALAPDSGRVLWQHDAGTELVGAPAATPQYVAIATRNHTEVLRTATGERVRSFRSDQVDWAGARAFSGSLLILPRRDGTADAVRLDDWNAAFRMAGGKRNGQGWFGFGETIYCATLDKKLLAFERL